MRGPRLGSCAVHNRLIDTLSDADRSLVADRLQPATFERRQVLFEPEEDVVSVAFPGPGVIASLVLNMQDGAAAEAAMIGLEGAVGGIISAGNKPAFARGVIQVGGAGQTMAVDDLEELKARSPSLREHFARYADCLLAQVLQSVACNAIHDVETRLARWLLATHDRMGVDELKLTQDFVAEMLGVQRTYVTRLLGQLADTGALKMARGSIVVADRAQLERQSCECYAYLRRHFERVLPGVYPAGAP